MDKKSANKTLNKMICLLISVVMLVTLLSGCQTAGKQETDTTVQFSSYHDIPGVAEKEIAEIEALRQKYDSFSYGMMLSTEAFINAYGEISGYAALVCNWLSDLFEIPFVPKLVTWEHIMEALGNGELDFTGMLTPTDARRQVFFMTDAITQRTIKYLQLAGSEPIAEITKTRLPRFALLKDSAYSENVLRYKTIEFEYTYVSEYIDAYDLMKNGEVDALIAESTAEAMFDEIGDIVTAIFFPLLHAPVSLTTQNPELVPIINVVQMALDNGIIYYFNELYEAGNQDYLRHKLFTQLTDKEVSFIRNNPVIPFASEFENYPVSFLSTHNDVQQWQGISHDVLRYIESLTGLTFVIVNDEGKTFYDLLVMLEDGEAHILSEVIQTEAREGRFLWPDNSFYTDWSVLISKANYPNVNITRVYSHKVGLTRGSAHTEFFNDMFPNHQAIEYYSQLEAMDALIAGEVDMIMASNSFFLYLTNYLELPDYKANVIFDNNFHSTFGINKYQHELRSIIDKALALVDTKTISEQWRQRTYDYRLTLAQAEMEAQRPWLIGTSALLVLVLSLLLLLIMRKRSEKQRLDELVRIRTAEVEAANKAKSDFLSAMSHEIRTPMNAIIGITEIQLQRDVVDAESRMAIERIYTSGDLLLGIINDILDLSKIEAGKLVLMVDKYEIASLVSDTAQLNMMRVGSKRIRFELHIDEDMPVNLLGDELRVKQIMNNLLSNAFKYTAGGTVKLIVTAEESAKKEDEIILSIKVSDTGQGMKKEQLDKLFDEYSRFNLETNRSTEGTGLGMSITKNLIRLMGGEISVESEYGVGSTFSVRLPQGRVGSEVLGSEMAENLRQFRSYNMAQMKRTQITREPMPYGSILIVDDVETNAYVAKGLLIPYELKIESVSSGYAAIERIKSGRQYDVIFMDHMMPEMDGVETTRHLREMGYNHPIVALTANAVAGQANIFLENGFDDFISKPIDLRQMNMLLNKLIRDKQPPDVIEAARKAAEARKVYSVLPQQMDDMEFVRIFIREAEKSLITLEKLTGKEEWYKNEDEVRKYIIHIHTIKSALVNIGKYDLSAVALKLEQAARNNITEIVIDESSRFFNTLRDFIEHLKKDGSEVGNRLKSLVYNRNIAGLDIPRGFRQANGDEKAYIQTLRLYTVNVRNLLKIIESVTPLEEGNKEKTADYNRAVHGIKGTSFYIFAEPVAHQAEALEKASATGDFIYVREYNHPFLEMAWNLINDLEKMVSDYDSENPRPVKPAPDVELLIKVRDACKQFDMDILDAAMEEMEKYRYESDEDIVDWLREAVNRMDMAAIVDRLKDI